MKKRKIFMVFLALAWTLGLHSLNRECFGQAAAFAPYSGIWEDEVILFNSVRLKLGLPQEKVMAELKKNYSLKKIDPEAWLILDKSGQEAGQMVFRAGKLSSISKDLGSFRGEHLTSAFSALFAILANMNKEGEKSARILTRTIKQGEITMDAIHLIYGKKKIVILIKESGPGAPAVTIREVLE